MAELTIRFPDPQSGRIIDALCKAGGFHGLATASRRAREEFARRYVAQHIHMTVARIEQAEAMAAALASTVPTPPLEVS